MKNTLLLRLFYEIFGEKFVFSDFNNRLEMQKMVYLLQVKGINIDNYSFVWHKHGPYSQKLMNTMLSLDTIHQEDKILFFSNEAEAIIDELRDLVNKYKLTKYSKATWIECVASLYYLKARIIPTNSDNEFLLNTLRDRKPHLKDEDSNNFALECLTTF